MIYAAIVYLNCFSMLGTRSALGNGELRAIQYTVCCSQAPEALVRAACCESRHVCVATFRPFVPRAHIRFAQHGRAAAASLFPMEARHPPRALEQSSRGALRCRPAARPA